MVLAGKATVTATYAQSVGPAIGWLADTINSANWRTRLPQLAAYPVELFDYRADDEALKMHGASRIAGMGWPPAT